MEQKRKLPAGLVYAPPHYDPADVAAIQALLNGTAEPAQQQRALGWIIELAAGTYNFHFHASERDTAFALGRAFVGQQIVKLTKLNASRLRSEEDGK